MLTDAHQLERRGAIVRILRGWPGAQAGRPRAPAEERGSRGHAVLDQPRPARAGRAQGERPLRAAAGGGDARQRRLRHAGAVRARASHAPGPRSPCCAPPSAPRRASRWPSTRRDWPEVVGTISGDDTIFIATANLRAQQAADRAPAHPLPGLNTMSSYVRPGRQAHRARLFRRPRHLVPACPGSPSNYGRPVITVTVDTGGIDAAGRAHAGASARARSAPSSTTRSMRAPTTSSRCCAS